MISRATKKSLPNSYLSKADLTLLEDACKDKVVLTNIQWLKDSLSDDKISCLERFEKWLATKLPAKQARRVLLDYDTKFPAFLSECSKNKIVWTELD